MGNIGLRALRTAFDVMARFVPRGRYRARVAAIPGMDEKNAGYDLRGWEYRKVPSRDGARDHRYYFRASAREGAPTVLLLHGLNLDGRTFLNMQDLAAEYELVAFDWPEASDLYRGRLEDFVELLDDFIEVMGWETVTLAGVSFGGMVAQLHAARNPSRVGVVVLISTLVPGAHEDQREQSRIIDDMLRGYRDDQLYWLLEMLRGRFLRGLDPADRARMAPILRVKRLDFYRQVAASMCDHDGRGDASRIEQPVLLLLGTKDELIRLETVADLRQAAPHARVELIHGAGHSMTFLQGEQMAQYVRDFLRDVQ